MKKLSLFSVVVVTCLASASAFADVVTYKEVKPLMDARCFKCHHENGSSVEGSAGGFVRGLARKRVDMTTFPFKSRKFSCNFQVSGNLYEHIKKAITKDETGDAEMPARGNPLSDEQIALIHAWINQGALDENGNPPACEDQVD